jgi:hypothetical protein
LFCCTFGTFFLKFWMDAIIIKWTKIHIEWDERFTIKLDLSVHVSLYFCTFYMVSSFFKLYIYVWLTWNKLFSSSILLKYSVLLT